MKKSLIIASIVSASMLALSGCESTGSEKSADAAPAAPAMSSEQASYDTAVAGAKAEQATAKKMGGEWRDIGKTLGKADKAAKSGDYAKATKLANKAANQGKLGQAQASSEAGVGNPGYLY